MEVLSNIIFEAVTQALATFDDAQNNVILPENAPTERGYKKYIFRLEKRSDEDDHLVVISAHQDIIFDCNWHTAPASSFIKSSAGYYLIDEPRYSTTRKGCDPDSRYVERSQILEIEERMIPYDSSEPIVIHALESIHVSYEVINKADADKVERHQSGFF